MADLIKGKNPCPDCSSADNLTLHEDGGVWCYTPECPGNKGRQFSARQSSSLGGFTYSALPHRRISKRTCEFFNYQVGIHNGVPIESANYDGCQQIRTKDKKFYFLGDTTKLTLWGKNKWSNNSSSLIITEGQIDAMSIGESQDCKWPVVSLPNGSGSARKSLQGELDWLLGFKEIILCFDNDEAGKSAIESCVDLFPPGRLKIAHLSEKDANDCLMKGKHEELIRLKFTAAEYRPDGIFKIKDSNIKELFKPKPRGYSLPFPLLDAAMRGLPKGRITTIYAKTGIGKTTTFKEILIHLATQNNKLKIAGILLEENKDITLEYLIAMQNNIVTWKVSENPTLLKEEDKIKAFDNLKEVELYDHFGSIAPNRLLNIIEYWAANGVSVVLLDHITMIFSGLDSGKDGQWKDIDSFMTKLRSLVERTQIHLITATQLKRRIRMKDGKGNDIIEEDDARGSGSIETISDYIIFLNRNKRGVNPNEIILELNKNRYTGTEGSMDTLVWNKETGRLLPIQLKDKVGVTDVSTETMF